MLFVGVSILSLFQTVGGQRGQEGVLWTEPNLIHTRQKKHNTIIASVSELGDDCPSSRGNGSQEVRPLNDVFLSFDSCFITSYYYFLCRVRYLLVSLCLGVFQIFVFSLPLSTPTLQTSWRERG